MGDRKYRQRGYQDSDSDRSERRPERKPQNFGPKTPLMPGVHSVSRCGGCGTVLPKDFDPWGRCPRCGFELHSCKQCAHFDTSYQFECTQPVPKRITQKNARNDCIFYAARMTVERQTSPTSASSSLASDPRKAFENLFRK